MDVVNVVGSGSLDVEIELSQLVDDLDSSIADYDPDKYPGVYLRFSDDTPLITIYRTGKYIVTGAESREQAHRYRDRFLNLLTEMGVTSDTSNTSFTIQNYVFVADLEKSQNLEALAIGLGLEQTEYEPEQFPGQSTAPQTQAVYCLSSPQVRRSLPGQPAKKQRKERSQTCKKHLSNTS